MRLLASEEALAHYRRGLELLQTLPESPQRAEREFVLLFCLAPPLSMTQGFAILEIRQIFTRARELCQQVGGVPELFWTLDGLANHYCTCGELAAARELLGQLLYLAQCQNDPFLLADAHFVAAMVLLYLGELPAFREHMEQVLAFYDPQWGRDRIMGFDFKMVILSRAALAFWYLGYPDQAAHWEQGALAMAQESVHTHAAEESWFFAAQFRRLRQEGTAVRELAEAVVTLADEHAFPYLRACGLGMRGWALVRQGQPDEGMAQIGQALDWLRANQVWLVYLMLLCPLADACQMAGRTGEGLSAVEEGLALVRQTESVLYEPELYRLKGELLLQHAGNEAEAEACFWQAIESARRQQAKSSELRAVLSLARLWR